MPDLTFHSYDHLIGLKKFSVSGKKGLPQQQSDQDMAELRQQVAREVVSFRHPGPAPDPSDEVNRLAAGSEPRNTASERPDHTTR